jgi:MFS family permease
MTGNSGRNSDAEQQSAPVDTPTGREVDVTPGKKTLFSGGVLSALGERDYALLWSGALISNIGTWLQTAALLWYMAHVLKTSNSWVAAVNMANFLPVLFLVSFAGSLADRYNRRKLIIAGQSVMMLGALALGISASYHVDSKLVIILTVSIIGVAFALNFPAWQAILPDMVPRKDMLNAIALSSAQWNLARFVGPVIGAALLNYFSPSVAFYANAVSFLFVIGALLVIQPKRGVVERPTDTITQHLAAGFHYVWHRRWMVNILLALSVVSFFGFAYIVLIPSLVQNVLHKGGAAYGFLLGMTGLGAVIGAPVVTVMSRRLHEKHIIKMSMLGLGVFLVALAISRLYWVSCLISIGLGASFLITGSAVNSLLQGCSEREMRGRVISFYIMVFIGVAALGGLFLGYVADATSIPIGLTVAGIPCLLTAAVLTGFPSLTRGAETCEEDRPVPFEPALYADV